MSGAEAGVAAGAGAGATTYAGLTTGELLALAAAVGGSALSYDASVDAQNAQRKLLQAANATENELAGQSRAVTGKVAQKYDPSKRAQALEAKEADVEKGLNEYLVAARDREGGTADTGNVSTTYDERKAAQVSADTKEAQKLARLMAKVRAPGELLLDEALDTASGGEEAGSIMGDARNFARASGSAIQQAGIPDPGKQMFGNLATQLGTAYAANSMSRGRTPARTGGAQSGVFRT